MPTEDNHLVGNTENQDHENKENEPQNQVDNLKSICEPNLKLIPAKIFYFTFLSSIAVCLPYSSVFMKQLGMSAFRIGVISGLRPFIGFCSGVCWGILADKWKLWRVILLASIFFWGLFYAIFYIIPDPTRKPTCFDNSTITPEPKRSNENISWLYEEYSLTKTFAFCILCICVGELLQSPTGTIADTLTLKALGSDGINKYGWQRAWGSMGMALNSLLAGYLLSRQRWTETICGVVISFSDYRILSILVIIFITICFVASIFLGRGKSDLETRKDMLPTLSVLKMFCSVHYGSWIAAVFYMGYANGTVWGFVFWHLDNLGASQLLMGIDSLCLNLVETVAYCIASYLITKIGHIAIMHVSLFMYSVRFALYAALSNPWWVIPIDILQGITFSTSWISIATYTTLMVPAESLATIQGIVHGVLFGLGNGMGHLIGGVFIEYYGAVWTFYGMSILSFVVFVVFVICQTTSSVPILYTTQ